MKYSKELTKEISINLKLGHTIEDACILSGIAEDTFYEFMKGNIPKSVLKTCKTDEKRKLKKSEFSESIKKAEVECKRAHIANIRQAAMGTRVFIDPKDPKKGFKYTKNPIWQASAWWLERRYKEEYSTKQQVEITDRKELNKIEEELRKIANERKH